MINKSETVDTFKLRVIEISSMYLNNSCHLGIGRYSKYNLFVSSFDIFFFIGIMYLIYLLENTSEHKIHNFGLQSP